MLASNTHKPTEPRNPLLAFWTELVERYIRMQSAYLILAGAFVTAHERSGKASMHLTWISFCSNGHVEAYSLLQCMRFNRTAQKNVFGAGI